jgi:hypothetical protein
MEHCSLCTVYCDQQVQYESTSSNFMEDQYRLSEATVGQLFQQMDVGSNNGAGPTTTPSSLVCGDGITTTGSSSPSHRVEEIKQCQSYLFDEESVIHSVHSRQDGDENDDTLIPPSGY